jgi:NADH-quinone oxidoreductase subunit C
VEAPVRSALDPAAMGERLRAQFGDDVEDVADQFGHAVVTVKPARYREIAEFLRDDPDLALDYFDFTAGVDLGESGFQVITHLYSTGHNHHVRLKVALGAEDPVCPTLSDIYAGANWHERETWELFGVRFEGHPHLVKLLLPEPFEGHPLRKDFELMTRVAKPWPGAPEGEEIEDDE